MVLTLFFSAILSLVPVSSDPGFGESPVLTGPWEFYPGEWLEPGDPRWASDQVRHLLVPASWNREAWPEKPAGRSEGRGTYRLRLERPDDRVPWGLSWSLTGSAARVLVDGREAARFGVLGTSEETEVPGNAPQRIPLGTAPEVTITVQVSNYHHVDGGLWSPLAAGPEAALERHERSSRSWDLLEAGACLLLGLAAAGMGLTRKPPRPLLWFGLTSLVLGVRILVHGHFSVYNLFPDLDWQLFQKLRHWTMYLGPLFFLLLLDSLFAGSLRKGFVWVVAAVCGLGTVLVLVLPYRWYGDLLYPFTALIVLQILYSFLVLWRHRRPSESHQVPILAGLALLVAGGTFEFVRVTLFLPLPEVMPWVTLLVVVLMGWGVSLQQAGLNRQVQVLADTKDTMLSIIAHDLRGPLHSASRYVNKHLLPGGPRPGDCPDPEDGPRNPAPPRDKWEAIPVLAQTLGRSVDLLENLLSWSLSQSGRLALSPQPVRLRDLVDEAAGDLDKVRAAKNQEFRADDSTARVLADRPTAVTVLRNLLSNAYKFTPAGGRVEVTFGTWGPLVEVRIADTGAGLTPEQLRRVLSLKEKVVTAGTEGEQGSGFGLFLCQEFLRRNGGHLRAESAPGKGSTFIAAFPRA